MDEFNEVTALKHLINKYKTYGLPLDELCSHNATVAREANYTEAAALWEMLPSVILANEPRSGGSSPKERLLPPESAAMMASADLRLATELAESPGEQKVGGSAVFAEAKSERVSPHAAHSAAEDATKKPEEQHEVIKLRTSCSPLSKNSRRESMLRRWGIDQTRLREIRQPARGNSEADRAAQQVDEISCRMLRDQIQYFADRNDIVTATVLAVIVWERVGLPVEALNQLATEYKGEHGRTEKRVELLERFRMDVKKTELLKIVPMKEMKQLNKVWGRIRTRNRRGLKYC